MNFISARTKIVIGLVGLLISVLLTALTLGLVPDSHEAVLRQRAQFCEAMAISSSELVSRQDVSGVNALLQTLVQRNPDLQAAGFRETNGSQAGGKILAWVGEGQPDRAGAAGRWSTESQVVVPVFRDSDKFGELEFHFRPIGYSGILGYILSDRSKMIGFVAAGCFVAYLLYLRKMLQHLDPSKVVPQRVKSALDNLVSGLFVIDTNERIVLANQAFSQVVGQTTEKLLGCRAWKLPWEMPGAGAGEALADYPWTRVLRSGTVESNVSIRLRCAGDELRTFMINCSRVFGNGGATRGVLVSLEDITPLELKEAELRQSRDAADKANSAKSEFLARMSHEIRTPLNAILGFADVLRRGFAENEQERQEYLGTIHSSGQHLLALINDILDLSKVEAGRMELEKVRCSPHQLIRQVVSELSIRAKEKNLSLEYSAPQGLPESITTDPVRFRQVLFNLAGNAIKFTPKGSVRIVARMAKVDQRWKLAVDVIDSGIGMSSESQGKIFQPFVQADTSITRQFGGTGLGLSITRRLTEAMGGGVSFQSTLGKGSTFTMTIDPGELEGVPTITVEEFARSASHSERGSAAAAQRAIADMASARVLVVDDGDSNRKLARLVLERAGMTVRLADNGADAIKLVAHERFDVILMDMHMPIMDGFAATAALRERGCKLPIIAMTADAMKGDEDKCLAAGCSGFLPKPIDMDRMLEMVAVAASKNRPSDSQPAQPPQAARTAQPAPSAPVAPVAAPVKSKVVEGAPILSKLPADDPEFCQIVDEFLDRLHQQMEAMENALAEEDLTRLAAAAHWLKGSGGTAGFDAFTQPASELVRLAREARIEQLPDALAELQKLASRAQSHGKGAENAVKEQHGMADSI